jgi:hypothetical protein
MIHVFELYGSVAKTYSCGVDWDSSRASSGINLGSSRLQLVQLWSIQFIIRHCIAQLQLHCCVDSLDSFSIEQHSVIGAEADVPRVELQCLKVLAKFLRHDEDKAIKGEVMRQ